MKKLIQSLLLAGMVASVGSLAYAQGDAMMEHDGTHYHDTGRMAQMHAKHMAELKSRLKITATQEAAWNTFTEALKPPADMTTRRPERVEFDKLPTPERIDKMRALHKEHMAEMEAAMDRRGEATKAFYATLSLEQKKVFDAEFTRMMHQGPREHRMGHPDDQTSTAPKQ